MSDDTSTLLVAGRRAAFAELHAMFVNHGHPDTKWEACTPEAYSGTTPITINDNNMLPIIDAAVMETVARLTAPHIELPEPLAKLRYLRPGMLPL